MYQVANKWLWLNRNSLTIRCRLLSFLGCPFLLRVLRFCGRCNPYILNLNGKVVSLLPTWPFFRSNTMMENVSANLKTWLCYIFQSKAFSTIRQLSNIIMIYMVQGIDIYFVWLEGFYGISTLKGFFNAKSCLYIRGTMKRVRQADELFVCFGSKPNEGLSSRSSTRSEVGKGLPVRGVGKRN